MLPSTPQRMLPWRVSGKGSRLGAALMHSRQNYPEPTQSRVCPPSTSRIDPLTARCGTLWSEDSHEYPG